MPDRLLVGGYGFGTFKGVYTPSLLTILGVVMYLRFGWVLGNVGLGLTLVIVTMSTAITFVTGLSISSLATNMRVGGGGAYYMVSRSLGVELGAAMGLPLYFAQALGISFYIAGFSESLGGVLPTLDPRLIGVVTLVALGALAYRSADLALKSQYVILALILGSLVSFFLGDTPPPPPASAELVDHGRVGFWAVFAVFFPAVTGIEAGIAMSGDLKDPSKSLPRGTLGAIVSGYVVYLAIPVFLSSVIHDAAILRANPLIMRDVAAVGGLIMAGIWGATLSSAMGAMLGAPRTLQALARDGVLPAIIGRGYGESDDPRIATAISFVVALFGVLLGDLNLIAPVLSMFFLTSYGLLNSSAAFAELIGSPSWRPRFRTPWPVAVAGAAGCLGAMVMIDAGATIVAAVVTGGVYWGMAHRRLRARFGDMRYGILMLAAQQAVSQLAVRKPDERNWRPNILVLGGSPQSRWYLVELAAALAQGRGFITVAAILPTGATNAARARRASRSIGDYLRKRNVDALVKVHRADSPLEGARELVAAYGFGPLVPNTILLGPTGKKENLVAYSRLVLAAYRGQRNVIVVRQAHGEASEGADAPPDEGATITGETTLATIAAIVAPKRLAATRIDVWWGGRTDNASLMLALGWLLHSAPGWEAARLRINTVVSDIKDRDEAERRIDELIDAGRLRADREVHLHPPGADVFVTIGAASVGASLVFLGMRAPNSDETAEQYATYYARLIENTEDLPATALVLAAEDLDFRKLFD